VISTNIAESSVTINDVVFVIDSGVKKEKTYDPATNMPCLDAALVAKANALQRKGRGRNEHPPGRVGFWGLGRGAETRAQFGAFRILVSITIDKILYKSMDGMTPG